MKCIGSHVAEIMPIRASREGHGIPILGERKVVGGSAMALFERAMVVSYRLSIVTVTLSITIQLQFAIECLRRSNQMEVGQFGPKFPSVPLE